MGKETGKGFTKRGRREGKQIRESYHRKKVKGFEIGWWGGEAEERK